MANIKKMEDLQLTLKGNSFEIKDKAMTALFKINGLLNVANLKNMLNSQTPKNVQGLKLHLYYI